MHKRLWAVGLIVLAIATTLVIAQCGDSGKSTTTDSDCNVNGTLNSGYCGDGTCSSCESSESCPTDCGSGALFCGDGICNNGETCTSCDRDCGSCTGQGFCGDGTCNNGETPTSCTTDCK